MLKRIMSLVIAMAMAFCLAAPVLALDKVNEVPVKVFIDEEVLILPDGMSAYAEVSETYGCLGAYYPLRPIVEALGGEMEWDSATSTAIVKLEDMTISLPANSYYGTVETPNWSEDGEYFDHSIKNGVTYASSYSDIFGWIAGEFTFDEECNLYLTSIGDDHISKTDSKIVLNGETLTLPENLQVIRYDFYAAYVPFRYVMETLGATVTWNAKKSAAVVVKGDAKITFKASDGYYECEKNGEIVFEGYVEMELNGGVMYVDVDDYRLAELLGINTGFDESTGAVLIDDADAIMRSNKASYNIINSYIAYFTGLTDSGYTTKDKFSFNLGITDVDIDCPQAVSVTGTADALMSKTAADMSMLVKMDMTQLLDMLREESPDDESLTTIYSVAEYAKNATLDINYDILKDKVYLRSNLLGILGISGKTWVEIDTRELLGISLIELMDSYNMDISKINVRDIIKLAVADVYLYDENDTGKDMLDKINSYISDAAFTKNGMSYVTSGELVIDDVCFKYSATVPMKYGKSTGGTLKLSMEHEDMSIILSEKLKDGKQVTQVDFSMFDGEGAVTVKADFSRVYEKTAKKPQSIPEDATVITLEELMAKVEE